jgi:hypothetical protein
MTDALLTTSTTFRTPSVIELPRELDAVTNDPFIDDLAPASPIAAPDQPIRAVRSRVERWACSATSARPA